MIIHISKDVDTSVNSLVDNYTLLANELDINRVVKTFSIIKHTEGSSEYQIKQQLLSFCSTVILSNLFNIHGIETFRSMSQSSKYQKLKSEIRTTIMNNRKEEIDEICSQIYMLQRL